MGHPRSFSNSPPLFEQVEVYHKEVEGLVFATGVGVLPAPAHVVFAVLTDDVLRPALWPNWKSGARLESMPPRELEQGDGPLVLVSTPTSMPKARASDHDR